MGRKKKMEPKYTEQVEALAHRYCMWLVELLDKNEDLYKEYEQINKDLLELSVQEYRDWGTAAHEFALHDESEYYEKKRISEKNEEVV